MYTAPSPQSDAQPISTSQKAAPTSRRRSYQSRERDNDGVVCEQQTRSANGDPKLTLRREVQSMTTMSPEQEAFALVISRHKHGDPEESTATTFQFFLEKAGIAPLSDMIAQDRPAPDGTGRMDLYVYNTCIEASQTIFYIDEESTA